MGHFNQFGDWVANYVVEMGRPNDSKPRIVRYVEAKCDYMAADIAEKTTKGYIAFKVYRRDK